MENYQPRVIVLNSNSNSGYQFLTGFVTVPNASFTAIMSPTLYPATESNKAYVLYEETFFGGNESTIKQLEPFTFYKNQPSEYCTLIQDIDGERRKKVKTIANQGHGDPFNFDLYLPRPFRLLDTPDDGSTPAFTYGILVDTYKGDVIYLDGNNLKIDSREIITEFIVTQIFLFDVNFGFDKTIYLDLTDQKLENKPIDFQNIRTSISPQSYQECE